MGWEGHCSGELKNSTRMQGRVSEHMGSSVSFTIIVEGRQGCVMSVRLFDIYISEVSIGMKAKVGELVAKMKWKENKFRKVTSLCAVDSHICRK